MSHRLCIKRWSKLLQDSVKDFFAYFYFFLHSFKQFLFPEFGNWPPQIQWKEVFIVSIVLFFKSQYFSKFGTHVLMMIFQMNPKFVGAIEKSRYR